MSVRNRSLLTIMNLIHTFGLVFLGLVTFGHRHQQCVSAVRLMRSKRFANPDSTDNRGRDPQQSNRRPGDIRTVCDKECVCEMPTAECRKANLRSIPSPFPRAVEKIIIAENPINTIKQNSFYKQEFASVNNLQLIDNQIKTLETRAFNGLGSVRVLSMRGNKIKNIEDMAFYGLRNLETLTLSSNQLKELHPDSFPFGMSIETIVLNDNKLHHLSSDLFDGLPSLQALSLAGNPWDCSCDLLGIFVWLQLPNTELREPDATCDKPPDVKGKTLQSFTNKEMQTACIEDDGEDEDNQAVDQKIDEACAEHNSSKAIDICYISETVFAQPGKKVCLHCAATIDPAEIERDLFEGTGHDLVIHWEAAENEKELNNETSDGMICFKKFQAKDTGTYRCIASFGNFTDHRSVSVIVNDLANKVGIGLAIFFGSFIVVVLLLLLRWWLKEVRGLDET